MTTVEFKKLVAQSNNSKWFNSVVIELKFPIIDLITTFTGFASIHKFCEEQILGWEKIDNLPQELVASKNFFLFVNQQLENFVNTYPTETESSDLENSFKTPLFNIEGQNKKIFLYDTAETNFLLKIYRNKPLSFLSAFSYLCGDIEHSIGIKDNLIGYLMAYEFSSKDSKLSERLNSEKTSLQNLKNNFKNSLPELDRQLVEHLKDSSTKYEEYLKKIDEFKNDKEKTYSDWFINAKGDFEDFDKGSKLKLQEIEQTYKEKLKLEGPAKYWSDRAKKLKRQGWIALIVLVFFVLIVCDSLNLLLWKTPEQIFSSYFKGDHSTAIRWSIIYITLISFLAFCIKAISKVMFSSFHLARDCEERHTLTYFYLALLKESEIDPEEKKLIMQSLFSRADTGLLKEDSSPTMPNDLGNKIFGGK